MKRRVLLWAVTGLLVGCAWVTYALATAPDVEQPSTINRVIQVLAYFSCPILAIGPRFYWVPFVNAATYALLGFALGSVHRPLLLGSTMQNRFKSIALYATVGIGLLLLFVGLFFAVEQRRTQAETGAVLSALFSQGVLHDMDKWDVGRPITIVVMRHPDCSLCEGGGSEFDKQLWFGPSLKSRVGLLSDTWFTQSSRITRASFFVNSVFSTDISTDLTLPRGARAVFINRSDLGTKPNEFEARFPNNFGFFVVSHVGLNLSKTEALLYVDHFCGGLCGSGDYFLMRKVNGAWHIVDRHRTWVS
jgi:hypothetical protein